MPKNIKVARCAAGTCLEREINPDGSVTLRSTTGLGGELTLTAGEWDTAVEQIAADPAGWGNPAPGVGVQVVVRAGTPARVVTA